MNLKELLTERALLLERLAVLDKEIEELQESKTTWETATLDIPRSVERR